MSGGGGGGDAFAEEPEAHENHERYLLTYADMITLLMALFIILFAIGQTDIAKFKQFQTGLQKQFGAPALDGGVGPLEGSQLTDSSPNVISLDGVGPGLKSTEEIKTTATTPPEAPTAKKPVEITAFNADQTAKTIDSVLSEAGLPKDAYEVDVDNRGVVIRLGTDGITFSSGASTLRPESNKTLDFISGALKLVRNDVIIEGHTDSQPMTGAITNWELSALRASTVLRYFATNHKLDPARLQVAGYADTRPLVPNDSEGNRTRNRRVEIVISLRQDVEVPSKTGAIDPAFVNPAKPQKVDVTRVVAAKESPTTTAKGKSH